MKDKLIYWQTWGHPGDGLISAPNAGFIDHEGEWHPTVSFGAGEIKTKEALLAIIESGEERERYDLEIFDLDQKTIDLLQDVKMRPDYLCHLVDALNKDNEYCFEMKCTRCGKHFASMDYSFTDIIDVMENSGFYTGDNGIGTITTAIWCDDCRNENQCDSCYEIENPDNQSFEDRFFWDWIHVCSGCTWKIFDKYYDKARQVNVLRRDFDELEKKIDGMEAELQKYLGIMRENGTPDDEIRRLETENRSYFGDRTKELVNAMRDRLQADVEKNWPNEDYILQCAKERL